MAEASIWIVDLASGPEMRAQVVQALASPAPRGFPCRIESRVVPREEFCRGGQAACATSNRPDLALAVLDPVSAREAKDWITLLAERLPGVPVILIVAEGATGELFGIEEPGVVDFATYPVRASDLLPRISRSLDARKASRTLVHALKRQVGLRQLIGESPCFRREVKKIPRYSGCDAGVLLTGETGTGKELFARAIHYVGPRSANPFVPASCAAIPPTLAENELFGHAPGAFTGATSSRAGLIQEAHGGTLFLDEIDCLPPMSQAKLLRFLQEKEFKRLGSSRLQHADVRVIAATNVDLEDAVRQGRFRGDLYYRLNVLPIRLPPLRERREDIALLAGHFLDKWAGDSSGPPRRLTPEALDRLAAFEWPGNVRELENVVRRAVVLCRETEIGIEDIVLPQAAEQPPGLSFREAKSRIVADFERSYIQSLLRKYQGNITRAACAVKKNRRALWELIRKHKIDVKGYVPAADSMDTFPHE